MVNGISDGWTQLFLSHEAWEKATARKLIKSRYGLRNLLYLANMKAKIKVGCAALEIDGIDH